NSDCFYHIASVKGATGSVYLTGISDSGDFPVKNAYQAQAPAGRNSVLARIDTTQTGNASLIFSTYFGGSQQDEANVVISDMQGNAYIAGYTISSDLPLLNPYQDMF